MVSMEELRGFMRQALSHGDGFDEAVDRCFGGPGPSNATAPQLERFLAAAEQVWAHEAEGFDRAADAVVAGLRDEVLVLARRIADWIRSLDARDVDVSALPAEPMERLGEMSGMLASAIDLMNRNVDDDAGVIERFRGTIGLLEPVIKEAIDAVELVLAGGGAGENESWVGSLPEATLVFVLKITLSGTDPAVWRRLRVPGNLTLGDLHEVIQVIMDWTDGHLHEFALGDRRFTNTMHVDDPEYLDEGEVTLDELGLTSSARLTYTYDFGDDWRHAIRVERVVDAGVFSPDERGTVVCVSGERAAPPEDCGGIFGYRRLIELLARPEESLDANDLEFIELFGDEFDPEEFDIDAVNRVFRGEAER